MAEIILVRHGKTAGNLEGQAILGAGLRSRSVKKESMRWRKRCVRVPIRQWTWSMQVLMIRCRQTAKILWPKFTDSSQIQYVQNLQECDFGAFENKNYQELSGNAEYQAWIDSNGTLPFPGGESNEAFRQRCCQAFLRITEELQKQEEKTGQTLRAAVVVHGGTIMAILERFGTPKKNYFDYQVKNGCGYRLTPVEGTDQWNYQYLQ